MLITRVLIRETQPLVLEGLQSLIDTLPGWNLTAVGDSQAVPRAAARICPDLAMLDASTGMRAALQTVVELREVCPQVGVALWMPAAADGEWVRALQHGVKGLLFRSSTIDFVRDCLLSVRAGQVWIEPALTGGDDQMKRPASRLTAREREIVGLVCNGMRNREIGAALGITPGTVKVHLMHVFEKTGLRDRFELAAAGKRLLGLHANGAIHQ